MPPKPSTAPRLSTRAKNADTHPGLQAPKRKRRTPAEMEADKKMKEDAKNAKEAKKMEGLKKIASLEERIGQADANDETPRPKVSQRGAALRNTRGRMATALFDDDNASEPLTDNISDSNDYVPADEPTDREPTAELSDTLEETDIEEEQPVKKRAKGPKAKVRDTINAARKKSASMEKGEMKGDDDIVIVDKVAYGKKAHEAARPSEHKKGGITNWSSNVSSFGPPPPLKNKATGKSRVPSLTDGSTASTRPSTRSALAESDIVILTSHKYDPSAAAALQLSTASDIDWLNGGNGLEDEDERNGAERDAVAASPTKGNVRLTSDNIVKLEEASKPLRKAGTRRGGSKWHTTDLPAGCGEDSRWRKVFVPTYIWFVAQEEDPWTVEDSVAKTAMQKIWQVVFGKDIRYKVTTDGPVFGVAQQRVSDAWRSVIGSTGLSVVNAFFESKQDLTDEERKAIAQHGLEHLRFLYSNSTSDDPREFKGIFCGLLILRTFAAHFSAIRGTVKVPGLLSADKRDRGGLVLSTASVQRALKLWATGTITLEMVADAKATKTSKGLTLPKVMILDDGSQEATSFNDVTWGSITRSRMEFVNRTLRPSSWEKIIEKAKAFVVTGGSKNPSNTMDVDGTAQMVDLSDSDGE